MRLSIVKIFLSNLTKLVLPPAKIGGLQVTNTSVRFMQFSKDPKTGNLSAESKSLRLPPGIVVEGRIKDRPNFIAALKKLRSGISAKGKQMINAVLTIPAGDVYVETFNLPALADKSIPEAAALNMEMISPNPIEESYYSWMIVGDTRASGGQTEILGAFSQKQVVDEMTSALEEAGFAVAAIEFSSLSLKRIMKHLGVIQDNLPYLLIKLTQEGLVFMILRNGELYFNYFHSWGKVNQDSGEISLDSALEIIGRESQRVLNFYSSHQGGTIKNIILITGVFAEETTNFLKTRYQGFELSVLRSDQDNLHGVRGAALRGLVPRDKDSELNLLSSKVVNAFWRDRINQVIGFWHNIALTAAIFVLVVFGASALFIREQANAVREANAANLSQPETPELIALQEEVQSFNFLVSELNTLKSAQKPISPLVHRIDTVAGPNISLSRLLLRSSDSTGVVNGSSATQDEIIEFRNRLADVEDISEINLPLTGIVSQQGGRWTFVLDFKIDS